MEGAHLVHCIPDLNSKTHSQRPWVASQSYILMWSPGKVIWVQFSTIIDCQHLKLIEFIPLKEKSLLSDWATVSLHDYEKSY